MKKIYILFTISLLSSLSLIAQNNKTKKADKKFDRFEFVDAAEKYLKIAEDGNADTYVYKRLADCYYNIFNTTEAEKWYAKVLETSDDAEVIYKYSQMLKANSKYDESNKWMKKFAAMRPADERAIAFMENPDYLPKILERGKKFNVQSLDFNSELSDFGGTLQGNKLYIVSARNSARKTYGWNEQPYLDILEVPVRTDGTYGEAFLLGDKINTKYHEGTVTFTPDGNTMYFSRESFFENRFEKDSVRNDKYGVLNLFKATKTDGLWGNVESLPFNSSNFSTDHPSLSKDGKTLYFTSDMPGGYGMSDIYKVAVNEDGSFGEPINLGQKVNTEGREMFPFSAEDETLYFSSDGHLGLGGLDVFFTKEIDGKMAPIRNLGIPINSGADDFAIVMNSEEEGFVSSNRMGGKGSDDIYAIKKLQPLCDVMIVSTVTDAKTGNIIQGATVSLTDTEGNVMSTKTTNADGVAEFIVECETNTELQVTMVDYESNIITVSGTSEEEVAISVMLDPIEKIIQPEEIILNPIYFDFDKSNITAKAAFELDKLVQVMNKYPEMVIKATSHTDSRGSKTYNQGLSDRRAKSTVQYVISKGIDASRIIAEGRGETEPAFDCTTCSEEQHQMNRRSQFLIESGGLQAK